MFNVLGTRLLGQFAMCAVNKCYTVILCRVPGGPGYKQFHHSMIARCTHSSQSYCQQTYFIQALHGFAAKCNVDLHVIPMLAMSTHCDLGK